MQQMGSNDLRGHLPILCGEIMYPEPVIHITLSNFCLRNEKKAMSSQNPDVALCATYIGHFAKGITGSSKVTNFVWVHQQGLGPFGPPYGFFPGCGFHLQH